MQLTEAQLELGKRAEREFIGSQTPRTTKLKEGRQLGFRNKWGKGHEKSRALCILVLASLWVALSFGFSSLSLQTILLY